jgi:cytochrome c-type biogenesis protein CcmH
MKGLRDTHYILRITYCVVFVLLLAQPLGLVFAQAPTPSEDDVNRIAKELYCPVCENTPLDVCPTQACEEWRQQIRLMLTEGKTEDEIKQYFVEYYGARALAEPPRQGFFWLIYIVPPAAILLGAAALARGFRAWKKPLETGADAGASEPQAEADEYVRRLEEELRRRK